MEFQKRKKKKNVTPFNKLGLNITSIKDHMVCNSNFELHPFILLFLSFGEIGLQLLYPYIYIYSLLFEITNQIGLYGQKRNA